MANSRFRFRAWDKCNKQMLEVINIKFEETPSTEPFLRSERWIYGYRDYKYFELYLHDVVLLQYTGLKDKKGTEIYEGDIISWQDNAGLKTTVEIVWKEGYPSFTARKSIIERGFSKIEKPRMEVIGNIYENPGLLS